MVRARDLNMGRYKLGLADCQLNYDYNSTMATTLAITSH